MTPTRDYDGPPIYGSAQHITDAPRWQDTDTDAEPDSDDADDCGDDTDPDGESDAVVYATDPEPAGSEQTENVPIPGEDPAPDTEGQSTLADWARWWR